MNKIEHTEVLNPLAEVANNKNTSLIHRKSRWSRLWRERWVYLLLAPGVIYFLMFQYLPLAGNVIAFQDFSPFLGFFDSPWVGLDNFARLFSDHDTATVMM